MKRLLLVLLLLCSIPVYSQIQWYKTTSMAIKYKRYNSYYGQYYWTDWSDWERCVLNVKFDLNSDQIIIYSNKTQIYTVLYTEDQPRDNSGSQIRFKIIDQDNDIGYLRLRIENNGNSQIYIDFNDVMWVYNVYRTN